MATPATPAMKLLASIKAQVDAYQALITDTDEVATLGALSKVLHEGYRHLDPDDDCDPPEDPPTPEPDDEASMRIVQHSLLNGAPFSVYTTTAKFEITVLKS